MRTCVTILVLLMLTGAAPALGQSSVARTMDRPALKTLFAAPPTLGQKKTGETERRPLALKGRPPDPWLGFDKVQHTTFSFLWTLGSQYTLVNKIDVSEARALPVSMTSGAFVGLAKEVYDWRWGPHRTFSYRDLTANAAGILLAAGLIGL